jgi:hypothetical protein
MSLVRRYDEPFTVEVHTKPEVDILKGFPPGISKGQQVKNFIKDKWQLFVTAFLQVAFVAMNVVFISDGRIIPMLATGVMISFVWTLNVKKIAFGGWADRIVYSIGAMIGTGIGYAMSNMIMKMI